MTTQTVPNVAAFLDHLAAVPEPFKLARVGPLAWGDQARHDDAWQHDPELYALSALAADVPSGQQFNVLFQLLRQGRAALPADVRQTVERVTAVLLEQVPAAEVLKVFLALRRDRANHKHVTRAVLTYLLNHPDLERLVRERRAVVVDCLEHALGRNTARGLARSLSQTDADARPLRRWVRQPERARAVIRHLYRQETLPRPTAVVQAARRHPKPAFQPPKTVTATNRGDIAATLVHIYRGGDSAELRAALGQYVEQAARDLPRFDGRLALVLDASESTRGYGEREFCCISQSQALRLALQRCCADLRVFTVGGTGDPPRPEGDSDLATALLDAIATEADLVAVVSDGYENVAWGDLARVAAALPAAGCDVPVVFCQSKFTHKDDLAQRRPAEDLPQLEFWHEADFAPLLRRLFTHARGQSGRQFLCQHLRRRLESLEKEMVCGGNTP